MKNPHNQVTLGLLSSGFLHLPMCLYVHGSPDSDIRRVPSMSWLIEYPSGQKVLFDLGIRKDIHKYTPAVHHLLQTVIKTEVPRDIYDSLAQLNLNSRDIDAVIFSHLHYDHVGDPGGFGPRTKFIVGPGGKGLLQGSGSYPSTLNSHYDSRLLPPAQMVELPDPTDREFWSPFGPFCDTHDYFRDGSLFIVNAPGHCPGHINLLLQVTGHGWVMLAGDTAHDARILEGLAETAVYMDQETGLTRCAHQDLAMANAHLKRVQVLARDGTVQVILAHDDSGYEDLVRRFGHSPSPSKLEGEKLVEYC